MAKTASSNYTAAGTNFQIPGADGDQCDRADIATLGQALEEHTHASTRGVQIPTGGIADDAVTAAKIADGAIDAAAKLGSDVVTTAKILDANVTAAKLASDAVTTVKILDANVTAAKLASDAVATAKIADSAVTTAKIADSAVTAAKLSGSTVLVNGRQGGDASDWDESGANNYVPSGVKLQIGAVNVTVSKVNATGSTTITFPEAFGDDPILFVSVSSIFRSSGLWPSWTLVGGSGTTQANISLDVHDTSGWGGDLTIQVVWAAIGPS